MKSFAYVLKCIIKAIIHPLRALREFNKLDESFVLDEQKILHEQD